MRVLYDSANQAWDVTWKDVRCRLRLVDGLLMNEYFGPDDRPGARPDSAPFGDCLLETRTMVNVGLAPHGRTVLWQLDGWSQPDSTNCRLRLRAVEGSLQAELSLEVDKESGLLICHAELVNAGEREPVEIDHAISAGVLLPPGVDEVVYLAGRWGAETQVQRVALAHSALVLESRSGKTGFEYAPYAALLAPEHAYVVELLWSGNWEDAGPPVAGRARGRQRRVEQLGVAASQQSGEISWPCRMCFCYASRAISTPSRSSCIVTGADSVLGQPAPGAGAIQQLVCLFGTGAGR